MILLPGQSPPILFLFLFLLRLNFFLLLRVDISVMRKSVNFTSF